MQSPLEGDPWLVLKDSLPGSLLKKYHWLRPVRGVQGGRGGKQVPLEDLAPPPQPHRRTIGRLGVGDVVLVMKEVPLVVA